MKHKKLKKLIRISIVFCLFNTGVTHAMDTICNSCCEQTQLPLCGVSFLQPRSQSTNAALRAIAHHNFRDRFCINGFTGSLSVTPFYSRSFKSRKIAEYFFGQNNITFSGSMIQNRGRDHILADYFGLSPAFESTVCLDPKISNFLLDFDLFLGLDKICNGLYFQAYGPLVKTRWEICLCETIHNNGVTTPYPEFYMAEEETNAPHNSIRSALSGEKAFGDCKEGIKFGKINGPRCQTKFADVNLVLGWLVVNRERGYVGLNLRTTIPTGTRPCGEFLFEPIAGNGRHWELGLGFTGRVLIWEKDGEQTLDFHADANFTHMFKTCQRRSFDFSKNCFGSRYILLKEFNEAGAYAGTLVPAINKTTLRCDVQIPIKVDFVAMFAYNHKNWDFDFGYNGFIRSREHICLRESIEENKYGIKGIQNVADVGTNFTQSAATLYGNNYEEQENVADTNSPIFISTQDLCTQSAATPKILTHKFFTHLSYAWKEKETQSFIPFAGIGWQIEFESSKPRCDYPNKPTVSLWGVWAKFGLAYN